MNEAPTGQAVLLSPLVTRVLAPNPSPYTYTGTQTHLVGDRRVAVIDPGPDDPAHLEALLAAIDGRETVAIVCTHTHRDHSPLSRALTAATGAPIIGCAPLALGDPETRSDAAFDFDYVPDRILGDGDGLEGDGWTLEAVATPGHTSNHLAFALPQEAALFTGDHVMGWSTSIVSPPDGDMGAYMTSLDTLIGRDDAVYYPGHGEAVRDNPQRLARSMLGHRKQREGQIVRLLATGEASVADLVARMYVGLDPRLVPAAERSVLAHLIDLARRGLAERRSEGLWQAG
ncbi:MBL fold metallo-hydrolase [Sphingomonas japonica]|uniref:Glyoxylase-like metal-dependent hydrolase (Beta-lactamase superfamily II) n=1 Tax=Sphingomonas japonica TaxID=511662 RepID=A0ABX0TZF1_9SPHN|nr:MBL fold metallo-hydrolase [Sphingomonas japonica]NIJ23608.1 glyoxylase-like metal-dependent hydrolase (beta-lactamase superfamily II) [Sphingomonas japonica]